MLMLYRRTTELRAPREHMKAKPRQGSTKILLPRIIADTLQMAHARSSDIVDQKTCQSLDMDHLSERGESSHTDEPVAFGGLSLLQHFSEHDSTSIDGRDIDFGSSRLLGVGSVAYVIRGKLRKHSVAVKTLRLEEDNDGAVTAPKYAADLATELDIVSMEFDHPNITKFLGAGTMELNGCDLPMIVYERVRGGSAEQLYGQASQAIGQIWAPEESVAFSLCRQLFSALAYLHDFEKTPIAHRDIKPANLLLSEDCTTLKLADFSLACPLHGVASDSSKAPSIAGSARYMAPELTAKNQSVIHLDKADIYSAALTSWFLIYGSRPFNEIGDAGMAHTVACQFVRPPVKDPALSVVLSAAWSMNALSRPCAAELAESFAALAKPGSKSFGKRLLSKAARLFSRARSKPEHCAAASHPFARTQSSEAAPTRSAGVCSRVASSQPVAIRPSPAKAVGAPFRATSSL